MISMDPNSPPMLTARFHVHLPVDMIARLDSYCAREAKKRKRPLPRSRIVREAIHEYLKSKGA